MNLDDYLEFLIGCFATSLLVFFLACAVAVSGIVAKTETYTFNYFTRDDGTHAYIVKEIRKFGDDRFIFRTNDFSEAERVRDKLMLELKETKNAHP